MRRPSRQRQQLSAKGRRAAVWQPMIWIFREVWLTRVFGRLRLKGGKRLRVEQVLDQRYAAFHEIMRRLRSSYRLRVAGRGEGLWHLQTLSRFRRQRTLRR